MQITGSHMMRTCMRLSSGVLSAPGEQVAGFKNRQDGSFVGVMVIKSDDDLEYFKELYGVEKVRKVY